MVYKYIKDKILLYFFIKYTKFSSMMIYSWKIFTSETVYQKKITFLMIRGGFFDEETHPTKIFVKILEIKIPNFGKVPSPWDENPESK